MTYLTRRRLGLINGNSAAPSNRLLIPLLLPLGAVLLVTVVTGVAYFMAYPIRLRILGRLGEMALVFPLHVLFLTAVAAVLSIFAWRSREMFAATAFGLAVILTTTMALTPTFAMWQLAHKLNLQLSLRDYVTNAWHLNSGFPQQGRSVVFGTANGSSLELDVWRTSLPDSGPLHPAVVLVHGGAWLSGNRGMSPDWNRWFNDLGYVVFDVEYRLPPPERWRDEIGDVKSALGWVLVHSAEYHVDRARITIMGASAGSNLAMLAAYSMGDPKLPPSVDLPPVTVRSVIDLYGPTDMVMLYYARPRMGEYIGGSLDEFPDRYQTLSPLTHINAKTPPTLMIYGTHDRTVSVDHARRLNQSLSAVGVPHEMYLLPATDHAFDVNWGGFGTQISREKIKAFLQKYG